MNYNKKIDELNKKIEKYDAKIDAIYDSYEEKIFSDDELNKIDAQMVNHYRNMIIELRDKIDAYQEKAKSAVSGGLSVSTTGTVIGFLSNHKRAVATTLAGIGAASTIGFYAMVNKSIDTDEIIIGLEDELNKEKDNPSKTQEDNNSLNGSGALDNETPNTNSNSNSTEDDQSLNNGENKNNTQSSEESEKDEVKGLFETPLNDIYNEEQVYARAKEIKEKYYDVYLKEQQVSQEEIEEQLRQINAGICENVSVDNAANTIIVINDLMFREEGNATDRVNGVTTSRTQTPGDLDLGIFCVDNTRGQKLLHELSEIRTEIIEKAGNSDISGLQKEYTELFLSSLLLQGYKSIDINALETGGMKYLTSIAFLNAATLCGDSDLVKVTDPLLLEETTLTNIMNRFNNSNCTSNMIDENGELTGEVEDVNIMGSFLIEMVSDNYNAKAMYKDDYSRNLK